MHSQTALHQHHQRHHSLFAHKVLPMLAHGQPEHLRDTLRRKSTGLEFLVNLWNEVGADVAEPLAADGLSHAAFQFPHDRVALVIRLPQPTEPPDAFLVALVFARERLADFPLRYFTLELATTLQGNPYTVIGEWTPQHEHKLHGEGPAPDAQMFMMAVRAIVDNDLPVHSWDLPHL